MTPDRLAVGYLVGQGVAGAVWWVVLVMHPAVQSWFVPPGGPPFGVLAFWLADGVIFIAGSLCAAALLARRHRWTEPLLWIVAGGTTYAGLYTVVLTAGFDASPLGPVLMIPAAVLTGTIAGWYHGRRT